MLTDMKDDRGVLFVTEKDMHFYELFGQLVSKMTDMNKPADVAGIEGLLIRISSMLRLSKGVTRLYRNPREEELGLGETLCCYDTGKEGILIHKVRVVTSVMSIAEMTVYMEESEPPLTDTEFERVDLVMRTTLSYVSRNRLRDIVAELAYRDDAGYLNIRSLESALMKKGRDGSLGGMAAIHYNLRHFSLINQQVGRECADEVMRAHYDGLAELLGSGGQLFRLGGDNFVAVCAAENLEDALGYLYKVKVPYTRSGGGEVTVRSSAGIYRIPRDFRIENIGDIMEKIMNASRAAQTGTEGRIVFYDETLAQRRENAKMIQQMFPDALLNREFHVYYQPKVNVATGELGGAEALCRWIRGGKVVPPIEFIPVLEQNNDICRLDYYMLGLVCEDIRRWLDEGRKVVRISVNMSRRHFTDPDMLKTILGIIDSHSVPHELIEIELTETTTDVGFKDLKRVVEGISEAGIYTAIDDFGVGYSSVNLIRGLPWNVLKLDKSFLPLDSSASDRVSDIIFRNIVSMSKEIGLECVTEGVETKEHLDILRENGCEMAQGYYFDRPLPVEEFEKRLDIVSYYRQ